jgi:glycosyltransferase involved in cell wall biosynthesis
MTSAERIRIMYVVPDLREGGAERHVTKLMPNLDGARFDTAVVCIGDEGKLFDDLTGTGTRAVALHRTKRQALSALRDLIREMRDFAPDVVITRGYNAEMLGRIAARLTGVPHSVVWVRNHGDIDPRGLVRRIADRLLDRGTGAYFGLAHSQIDYMVNDLGYSRGKIRVIHNGVDPDSFEVSDDRTAISGLGVRASDKVVGIVAVLRAEKDHATFLRAARSVVDRVPNTKFLIVGDGPMRPEIEKLTAEMELDDKVVLTGSRSDIADLLRAMDVFVLSSRTVECFPNALLEAMAAGRPAVCTDVGAVSEMIADAQTGYVVPARDAGALADRLVEILSDSDFAHRMGRAARARVEASFTLRGSVEAAEHALDELVGNGRLNVLRAELAEGVASRHG